MNKRVFATCTTNSIYLINTIISRIIKSRIKRLSGMRVKRSAVCEIIYSASSHWLKYQVRFHN